MLKFGDARLCDNLEKLALVCTQLGVRTDSSLESRKTQSEMLSFDRVSLLLPWHLKPFYGLFPYIIGPAWSQISDPRCARRLQAAAHFLHVCSRWFMPPWQRGNTLAHQGCISAQPRDWEANQRKLSFNRLILKRDEKGQERVRSLLGRVTKR